MNTIKENRLFRRIYYKGKKEVGKQLVLYYLPSKNESLVGYTVRKKVGKAVVRNKVRRRIKESFRKYEKQFNGNYYIVIVARSCASEATFADIDNCLKELFIKAEIIQ